MIPLLITVMAFCAVAYLTKSITYSILALAYSFNAYLDNFTRADDPSLMVIYSSIDFVTCLAIMYLGDIHKLYQSSLLFAMLALHFAMEAALVYDYVPFIESGIYTYTMTGLIIAQLMGASRGTDKLYWPDSYRLKAHRFSLLNHQQNYTSKKG